MGASVLKDVDFRSIWLILAFCMFLLIVVLGVLARTLGTMILIDPKQHYEKWLHYSEWEFKKNAIYWAGEHFRVNKILINRRGLVLNAMSLLLFIEVILLSVWATKNG